MNDAARFERREVFYSGHVQGVGFRYTTVRIARRFGVTGFVRNLPDGRVQLVAEGEPPELVGFLGEVQQHLGEYIRNTQSTTEAASGEFHGFEVRS